MRLTDRQLNRASLGRQLLLGRKTMDVVDAVHRVVALQAQEPASPYVALWNRLAQFDAAELDRAFAEQAVLKAQLMRLTLHAVDARDYPDFYQAMRISLRAARLNDRRFTRTGLSSADADALMPEVLEFGSRPRTNAEAEAWLDERLGVTAKPGVWWALRQYGPFWHHPTGGAWSFGARPSYVAAGREVEARDPATSMQWLARRYLEGFGPATVQDLAQFSTIYRPPARVALAALGEELVKLEGPNGAQLFDLRGALLPDEDTPAPPRLMAMWDSLLLAYVDRSRVIPPDYRKLVMRSNGDVLPAILVDGYVAGVWRPSPAGIEIAAFQKLARKDWTELEAEARAMVAFLAGRDPDVYRRYAHWWRTLPSREVRVVGV